MAGFEFGSTIVAPHDSVLCVLAHLVIVAIAFGLCTKSGVRLVAHKRRITIGTHNLSFRLGDFLAVRQSPTLLAFQNARLSAIPGLFLVPWWMKDRATILTCFLNRASLHGGDQMKHPMRLVILSDLFFGYFCTHSEIIPKLFQTLIGCNNFNQIAVTIVSFSLKHVTPRAWLIVFLELAYPADLFFRVVSHPLFHQVRIVPDFVPVELHVGQSLLP